MVGPEVEALLERGEAALQRGELATAEGVLNELRSTRHPDVYLASAPFLRRLLLASVDGWDRFPTGADLATRCPVDLDPPAPTSLVALPRLLALERLPYNACRFPPLEPDNSGWFVWVGDDQPDPDVTMEMTVQDLVGLWPEVAPYLALPIGWYFQVAPDHEDIWPDAELLES